MFTNLLRLILIYTAIHYGINAAELITCHTNKCQKTIQKASSDVLRIDWRPISIWPEEAKRFK